MLDQQDDNKMSEKTKLGVFILLGLLVSVAVAGLISSVRITNTGTIKGIDITVEPDNLIWGKLNPFASKSLTVLLTSTSNIFIALNMTTSNLPSYLTLSWDCEGYKLAPTQSVNATFTLTVSASAPQGSFQFDIIVWGKEE